MNTNLFGYFFKNPIFLVAGQVKIHFKPAKLIPIFDVQNI